MGIPEIISLFSGVALFLFGMSLMGEGLNCLKSRAHSSKAFSSEQASRP